MEGDAEAWRRRLAIVEYKKPKPKEIITSLADIILKDEGSGVLNWALQGLKKLIEDKWQFKLTPIQKKSVDRMLLESDSPREFVRECIVKDCNNTITQDDCYGAYVKYCQKLDWTPLQRSAANHKIEQQIMRQFGVNQRNDIRGSNGKDQRGWKGVKVF